MNRSKALLTGLAILSAVVSASPALAVGGVDDLFAAFNVTGLNTNVQTILLAGVVLMTLFIGYKFLKKAGNNM